MEDIKTDVIETTPPASSTETVNTDQTLPPPENKEGTQPKTGDENLADHPRWKERETDWTERFNSQEKRHVDELASIREELDRRFSENREVAKPTEIPDWFGGNEQAWAKYQLYETERLAKVREETLKEFSSRTDAEQKRIEEATKFLNDEVGAIEADKTLNREGQKVDRNKLLKIAIDEDLVDSKGRWNYKAAFKMMKPSEVFQAKSALDEKKKLASATTANDRAETKPSDVKTHADFIGKGWDSL